MGGPSHFATETDGFGCPVSLHVDRGCGAVRLARAGCGSTAALSPFVFMKGAADFLSSAMRRGQGGSDIHLGRTDCQRVVSSWRVGKAGGVALGAAALPASIHRAIQGTSQTTDRMRGGSARSLSSHKCTELVHGHAQPSQTLLHRGFCRNREVKSCQA